MKLESISRLIGRLRFRRTAMDEMAAKIHAQLLATDERLLINDPLAALADIVDTHPESKAEPASQLAAWIDEAFPSLPPEQQYALIAHKRDQLSQDTSAEKLGVKVADIQDYYAKGKAALRISIDS